MRWISMLALMVLTRAAAAAPVVSYVSGSDLGFGSAQDLSDTPMSQPVLMSGKDGHFTQLTWVMQVTWGTSAEVEVKCQVSGDGSAWGWVPRCTDAAPHACSHRVWEFTKVDWPAGLLALNLPSNYRWAKCQWDDPGDGTGTIVGHGIRGQQ